MGPEGAERLWSPWRMEYIEAPHPEEEECFFCQKLAANDDEANLILTRSGSAFGILNAYPYNPGHLMVAPIRHIGELEELSEEELADGDRLLQTSVRALKRASDPHGFNIGMNLGRVAGAGVPGHLHWHVVPRWKGDTNFMAVVGHTRVLPEALAATYAKLRPLCDAT
jgi:ATP adenylyltransferase